MALTKRRQAVARTGGVEASASGGGRAVVASNAQAANDAIEEVDQPRARSTTSSALDAVEAEFETLLPSVRRFLGLSDEDVRVLREALAAGGASCQRERDAIIVQWRIMAVTYGFEHNLGVEAARRARLQFRMSIMGEQRDESGGLLMSSDLAWKPEGVAHDHDAHG